MEYMCVPKFMEINVNSDSYYIFRLTFLTYLLPENSTAKSNFRYLII